MQTEGWTSAWRKVAGTTWFESSVEWIREALRTWPEKCEEVGQATSTVVSDALSGAASGISGAASGITGASERMIHEHVTTLPSLVTNRALGGVCVVAISGAALATLVLVLFGLVTLTIHIWRCAKRVTSSSLSKASSSASMKAKGGPMMSPQARRILAGPLKRPWRPGTSATAKVAAVARPYVPTPEPVLQPTEASERDETEEQQRQQQDRAPNFPAAERAGLNPGRMVSTSASNYTTVLPGAALSARVSTTAANSLEGGYESTASTSSSSSSKSASSAASKSSKASLASFSSSASSSSSASFSSHPSAAARTARAPWYKPSALSNSSSPLDDDTTTDETPFGKATGVWLAVQKKEFLPGRTIQPFPELRVPSRPEWSEDENDEENHNNDDDEEEEEEVRIPENDAAEDSDGSQGSDVMIILAPTPKANHALNATVSDTETNEKRKWERTDFESGRNSPLGLSASQPLVIEL